MDADLDKPPRTTGGASSLLPWGWPCLVWQSDPREHTDLCSAAASKLSPQTDQCKGSLQKGPCQRTSSGWALGGKDGREEGEIPTKHLVRVALIYPAWLHAEWWEPGYVLVWHRAWELNRQMASKIVLVHSWVFQVRVTSHIFGLGLCYPWLSCLSPKDYKFLGILESGHGWSCFSFLR